MQRSKCVSHLTVLHKEKYKEDKYVSVGSVGGKIGEVTQIIPRTQRTSKKKSHVCPPNEV
jgi:hypothetical protein